MQVDLTERFGDDQWLGPDDWIETTPINRLDPDPESVGLPSLAADDEEVYRIAAAVSAIRESLPLDRDGVYCPVCHIANIDRGKLRTPCPKCGRGGLRSLAGTETPLNPEGVTLLSPPVSTVAPDGCSPLTPKEWHSSCHRCQPVGGEARIHNCI
jgi:hypothetical protein